jgi:nitrous oxidase accessory protein
MENKRSKKSLLVGLIILGAGVSFLPFVGATQQPILKSESLLNATWIVDNEGDEDFTTIQAAVDAAVNGDTIQIYSGMYIENIQIEKALTLTGIASEYLNGIDTGKPIIDGNNTGDVVAIFTEGETKPITISGFIIQNSGNRNSAIIADFSNDITISNNDIIDNHHGIYIYHSCSTIEENLIANNEYGILSEFADHCIIIIDNDYCMQLESSHQLTINRNEFNNNNKYGLILIRSPINKISFNNFINNTKNAWFKNCWNMWNDNYWGNRIIPLPIYVIIGEAQTSLFPALRIPILQFDLRAKATPN